MRYIGLWLLRGNCMNGARERYVCYLHTTLSSPPLYGVRYIDSYMGSRASQMHYYPLAIRLYASQVMYVPWLTLCVNPGPSSLGTLPPLLRIDEPATTYSCTGTRAFQMLPYPSAIRVVATQVMYVPWLTLRE